MKKRWVVLALCLALLQAGAMAEESDYLVTDSPSTLAQNVPLASNDPLYAQAVAQLEAGDLVTALNQFARLGSEADAPSYTAFTKAMLSLRRSDPKAAEEAFAALGDFYSSAYWAEYARSVQLHRFVKDGKFGYVDLSGTWKVQPQFDWAERTFREESAAPYDDGAPEESLLLTAAVFEGETETTATDVQPLSGRYGLMRSDGTLIVPVEYTEILWTEGGFAAVRDAHGSCQLYDLLTGQTVGGPYENIGGYGEGRVAVKQGGVWDYVNRAGERLGGAWAAALPFSEGYAGVTNAEGLAGFINESGAVVIELQYQGVGSFSEGYAAFRQKKKWGFVDARGTVVIEPIYKDAAAFVQGRCAVQKGGKWGIIDKSGEWVLKAKYDEITAFDPVYHRAWMRNNKLWGMCALDGAVVLKPSWATYTDFGADGASCVSYKKRYGYIDPMGALRIQNLYVAATRFSGGYGGTLDEAGVCFYQTKLGKGFTLDSDVPAECLNGFIEGRKVTAIQQPYTDDNGDEQTRTVYAIAFSLYDGEGNPIEVS
ncbi:MAG: WG repeat-containing protein [Eubacteriales bacterium]|nr:WG repeat-containing protein [Eubacteriales bacterium]